jgi:hypothetical protein
MSILDKILKTAGALVPSSMAALALREHFNHRYSDIGAITSLHIDSAKRRASVDFELKGESLPIHIAVERYELHVSEGRTFIELKDVTASREWIVQLARQCLIGKKFEVPESFSGLL